jgi:acyl-ACP thioesterase
MLDSAWGHTKDTDFSYSELDDEGQFWVLSRFLAVFHNLPRWDDEIIVETWGKGTDKLFGLRDFVIHSRSTQAGSMIGEKLVSATSAWLIIDRKTSRVQRIESLGRNFPMQLQRNELDIKLEKIQARPAEHTGLQDTVRYSDLDVNKHVSSSKYMQWILDSFPIEYYEGKNLKSFEIDFLAEAKLGDKVSVLVSDTPGGFYCEVKRDDDNADLCRAIVLWND